MQANQIRKVELTIDLAELARQAGAILGILDPRELPDSGMVEMVRIAVVCMTNPWLIAQQIAQAYNVSPPLSPLPSKNADSPTE